MELTKEKLDIMMREGIRDLEALGHSIPKKLTWKLNRSRNNAGEFSMTMKETVIRISSVVASTRSEKETRDAILHELIHSIVPYEIALSDPHGGEWLKISEQVNQAYGTHITANYSANEDQLALMRYKITCKGCGMVSYANRKTKWLQQMIDGVSTKYCKKCKSTEFDVEERKAI